MAEKRMFAKSIVLTDAFLDMPMSARCLYFTLGMLADDDGFVGSPKSIMRQCGASQDDLAILLSKRFVLGFDSGVIVIKHWRINNYLQKDRVHPTTYQEELSTLMLDKKGAYTERESGMYTGCIQDVYREENRLVEGRLEESSVDQNKKDISTSTTTIRPAADVELQAVMSFYMDNISKAIPSDVTTRAIQGFIEDLGADVVLHAMEITAEAEAHDWRYCKRILERYRDSGLRTLEAVAEDEAKARNGRAGWKSNGRSGTDAEGDKPVYGTRRRPASEWAEIVHYDA